LRRFVAGELPDRFEIPSRLGAIDDARAWATGHLRARDASDLVVWELELVLTEALSNVVRHAYGGAEDGRIELSLLLDDERIELEIVHFGDPFDRVGYSEPDLDAAPTGGYGIHLIGELMDEVKQKETPGGGTSLRLIKRNWRERE
jgi:serine/threonine-protein kinase RsbW